MRYKLYFIFYSYVCNRNPWVTEIILFVTQITKRPWKILMAKYAIIIK